jgi:predicted RNase H-like HicB family nuclease
LILVPVSELREATHMNLGVETEQETDGRWIAEIPQVPGALAYGASQSEAITRVKALALRVLAEQAS